MQDLAFDLLMTILETGFTLYYYRLLGHVKTVATELQTSITAHKTKLQTNIHVGRTVAVTGHRYFLKSFLYTCTGGGPIPEHI